MPWNWKVAAVYHDAELVVYITDTLVDCMEAARIVVGRMAVGVKLAERPAQLIERGVLLCKGGWTILVGRVR